MVGTGAPWPCWHRWPQEVRQSRVFLDADAGFGLSAHFAKAFCGIDAVAIAPGDTGEVGPARIFGVDVRTANLDRMPADVISLLRGRRCLLRLGSAIGRLPDPAGTLRSLMTTVDVEAVAAVAPDATTIARPGLPLATLIARLGAGGHRHVPTADGMARLFARLGFAHSAAAK